MLDNTEIPAPGADWLRRYREPCDRESEEVTDERWGALEEELALLCEQHGLDKECAEALADGCSVAIRLTDDTTLFEYQEFFGVDFAWNTTTVAGDKVILTRLAYEADEAGTERQP
jgi:hypothetical protein